MRERERATGEGGDAAAGLKAGDRARGGHGCHQAGVAGMRLPRGAACLTRSDASVCVQEEDDAGTWAWATEAELGRGRGMGARREGWAGFGQRAEKEAAAC
jgi:hypothetical protein